MDKKTDHFCEPLQPSLTMGVFSWRHRNGRADWKKRQLA
jgi:hypothetical protein